MDAHSTNEHIPWNEEISIVFIDSVILKGAYKAKRGVRLLASKMTK